MTRGDLKKLNFHKLNEMLNTRHREYRNIVNVLAEAAKAKTRVWDEIRLIEKVLKELKEKAEAELGRAPDKTQN